MRASVVSQTGAGNTQWVVVDTWKESPHISVACVVSGTVNYTIEHTFDDVLGGVSATAWANSGVTGATANASAAYDYPIKAVRVTVNSGTGTVTMTVLQTG